ncbi:MAG: hypothetical protein Q9164_005113 [Protoblastenia rupestris]
MIRRKPHSPPSSYLRTPSPEPWSRSTTIVSDCDADDEDTMSMDDLRPSPPLSVAITDDTPQAHGPYLPERPTLPDVLSNSAPPPWTLSAFTAYLSQNHCLENLEFTLDAERYKEKYEALILQMSGKPFTLEIDECRQLSMLWRRLLDAYIMPDCPREINIPSDVRQRLLTLPVDTVPPEPEALDDAVKIIYNLMEESVLVSFLNEAPPSSRAMRTKYDRPITENPRRKRGGSDSSNEKKCVRSKSRRRASPKLCLDAPYSSSDPTGRLTPSLNVRERSKRAPSHTSSGSGDPDSMTDDSASAPSPGREPMTPPNTPPSSDFGESSPKSRTDNTWKKMLGWKTKSTKGARQPHITDDY